MKTTHFLPLFVIVCLILSGCSGKQSTNNETTEIASSDTLVYDTAPRWSKTDTGKLLFYTYRHDPEGAELYTMNSNKTDLTRITDTYHNEWWSDFSPTDDLIYMSSDKGKSKRFGGSEIFSLKPDGTFTRLTYDTDTSSFNIYPRVSSDGTKLLYCANCIGNDVNSEVILMDADGSNPINLSDHPTADRYGTWSPDNQKVLFQSNRTGNFELFVLDLATRELTQFTNNESNDIHADWSVNDEIAFISDRDGDFELFTMSADGSNQKQLTFNSDRDVLPSWSPDGNSIAFSSYRFGKKDKGDIFLIDRDGTNEVLLTGR